MSQELRKLSRALISVSDKTDLLVFAQGLVSRGVQLISTGAPARPWLKPGSL